MPNATRIVPVIVFSILLPVAASAQGAFANPPEIVHKDGHLKAVMQLGDAERAVPNGNSHTRLRMFQGWPLDDRNAKPAPDAANVAPGPTLRGRVGGRVDVMFLNKVDDANFHYTTDTAGSPTSADCDHAGAYPFNDVWPDCFHGSSTSNMHFHGTHTSPDGLGDNVLVQVLPNKNVKQSEWQADFDAIFNARRPPQHWSEMPRHYQIAQLGYTAEQILAAAKSGLPAKGLVGDYDTAEGAKAKAAGRPAPQSLWLADFQLIRSGQWPEYVVGAFPNALEIPDYKDGKAGFRAGQAPGTHWYHAHKHGSTALHIFNGLSGVLILEGDYDDKLRAFFKKQLPASRKLVEQVMVFQQIVPSQNLEKSQSGANAGKQGTGDNPQSGNNQKLINGKINPTVQMMPGEIQLWRMVNAMGGGGKGTLDATLLNGMIAAGFEIRQVAYDGVQFDWDNYLAQPFFSKTPMPTGIPNAATGLTLAAGNRADLLVKAPTTSGTSRFTMAGDLNNVSGTPFLVLSVAVAPPANDPIQPMHFFMASDRKEYPVMPRFLKNLAPPPPGKPARIVTFSADKGPPNNPPPRFTIDAAQFSLNPDGTTKDTVDQCVRVNSTEDWLLVNDSPSAAQVHPFHIHINPFQILEVTTVTNGVATTFKPAGPPIWSDVVSIPANGGSVKIRQQFNDFLGTYVLHCHILAHEDRGMMQLVRTIPADADPAKACKLNGVQHH
jgi:FtsP/CotA-like multicopper oxidase with cupredoxin domain